MAGYLAVNCHKFVKRFIWKWKCHYESQLIAHIHGGRKSLEKPPYAYPSDTSNTWTRLKQNPPPPPIQDKIFSTAPLQKCHISTGQFKTPSRCLNNKHRTHNMIQYFYSCRERAPHVHLRSCNTLVHAVLGSDNRRRTPPALYREITAK